MEGSHLDIQNFIENAWEKIKRDFDEACRNGTSIYWNEEVLRLKFFHYLLNENIHIELFSAELETHIEGKTCYPDLIVDFKVEDETARCVFELKFWGSLNEWREDWNRVLAYKETLSYDYGYFLAIGPSTRSMEFQKDLVRLGSYQAKVLIYGKTWKETFGVAPPIKIAEGMLKKILNMPYHVIDPFGGWGWVSTLPEDYTIIFDAASKEDKLLVLLGLSEFEHSSERTKEVQEKLRELGFDKYVKFDDETLAFQQTDTMEWGCLIQELEVNTFPENVEKLRTSLTKLKPILAQLKPPLELY